ncbi:hypothetical protein ACWD26_20975 [Streptomyces sp. NPDC002787]
MAVTPPRGHQEEAQEFGQADGHEGGAAFGVRVEDGAFLAALAEEEERAAGVVPREAVQRGARREVDLLAVVTQAQVGPPPAVRNLRPALPGS